jgi:hypothetical protein
LLLVDVDGIKLKVLSREIRPKLGSFEKLLLKREAQSRHFCLSAFSKAELRFPILFVESTVYWHWSQHRYRKGKGG